jgi:hypothetical protein
MQYSFHFRSSVVLIFRHRETGHVHAILRSGTPVRTLASRRLFDCGKCACAFRDRAPSKRGRANNARLAR